MMGLVWVGLGLEGREIFVLPRHGVDTLLMPRLTPSTLRRSSAKSTPSPDDAKYDNALTLLAAARESYGAGDHQSAITNDERPIDMPQSPERDSGRESACV